MATNKNFEVKNGLTIAGTERISSAGAFTGSLASATTATTQSAADSSTKIATTAYTDAAITAIIGGAPGTLDTLNELAAAINDDASYASTLTTALATKLPLAGGTLTGVLTGTEFNVGVNYAGKFNAKQSNADAYGIVLEASANDAWLRMGHTGTYAQIDATYNSSAGHTPLQLLAGGSARMHIATDGNVGIGTTPKAYHSDYKAIDINNSASVMGYTGNNGAWLMENLYIGTDGNWKHKNSDFSSAVEMYDGVFNFYNTASGTADATATLQNRLKIDASGNVGIGAAPNTARLKVEQSVSSEWAMNIKHASTGVNYGLSIETSAGATNDVGALQVYPPSGGGLIFTNRSKLGIGTTAPQKQLHIIGPDGTTSLTEGNSRTALFIDNAGATYVNLASSNSANAAIFFSDADANNRGALLYKHASDSLAFTTAGTERMNIYNNGLTTIDASSGSSVGNLRVKGTSGHSYIGVSRAAASQGEVGYTWNNNTTNVWWNYLSANSSILNWYSSTGTKMTLNNSSGDLYVTAGNVKVSSGKGIDFSSAGNASGMTSELLDDYEEGVYDATISCASGSITLYTSYTRLRYTKIGRQVHIHGKLAMSAVSSPSGATNLNLPFASANDTNRAGVANNIMTGFFNGSAVTNGIYPIYGDLAEASSNCRLFIMLPPVTNNIGDNHVAAGSDIHVNFTYTVQ